MIHHHQGRLQKEKRIKWIQVPPTLWARPPDHQIHQKILAWVGPPFFFGNFRIWKVPCPTRPPWITFFSESVPQLQNTRISMIALQGLDQISEADYHCSSFQNSLVLMLVTVMFLNVEIYLAKKLFTFPGDSLISIPNPLSYLSKQESTLVCIVQWHQKLIYSGFSVSFTKKCTGGKNEKVHQSETHLYK